MALESYKLNPYGVSVDTDPHDLDDSQWSDVQNMRMDNLAASKFRGESLAFTPTNTPYHLLFNGNHEIPLWYYMGDAMIVSTDLNTETDITPVGLASGTNWDASLFNLNPIFNNTIDTPQVDLFGPTTQDLPAFPANTSCMALRPYRSFLIALNITQSAVEQPNRLIWSDSSDAGALPASWDISDPTTLAGDAYLTSSRGVIIDGLQMRDLFIVYKTHATYILRLIAGQSVMKIEKVEVNTGILAKDCAVEVKGNHIILTDNDVVIFDGQSVKSIAEKRVKDRIQGTMDKTNFANSYLVRYEQLNEVWVCWPEKGQTYPNIAAVWNWRDDVWTFRTIGISRHMMAGVTSFRPPESWDTLTGTWDTLNTTWQSTWAPKSQSTVSDNLLKADDTTLEYVDDTEDINGVAMPSKLEKVTMDFGVPDVFKMVNNISPRITAKVGTKIYIRIGVQDHPDDLINWLPETTYTVGLDRQSSVLGKGRFISLRMRTQDIDTAWKCHAVDISYRKAGAY